MTPQNKDFSQPVVMIYKDDVYISLGEFEVVASQQGTPAQAVYLRQKDNVSDKPVWQTLGGSGRNPLAAYIELRRKMSSDLLLPSEVKEDIEDLIAALLPHVDPFTYTSLLVTIRR
jgi:hypothetical protein